MIKTIALLVMFGVGSNAPSYMEQGFETLEACQARIPEAAKVASERFCSEEAPCPGPARATCVELSKSKGTEDYYTMRRLY